MQFNKLFQLLSLLLECLFPQETIITPFARPIFSVNKLITTKGTWSVLAIAPPYELQINESTFGYYHSTKDLIELHISGLKCIF